MSPGKQSTITAIVDCDCNQGAACLVRKRPCCLDVDWVSLEFSRRDHEIVYSRVCVDCQLDSRLVNVAEKGPVGIGCIVDGE